VLRFGGPAQQHPVQMQKLAKGDGHFQFGSEIYNYPPKSTREVFDLVVAGQTREINLVEWHFFLGDRKLWSDDSIKGYGDDLIVSVFSEVEINAPLRSMVLLKAALTLEKSEQVLPRLLSANLHILVDSLDGLDKNRFELINHAIAGNEKALLTCFVSRQWSPSHLLRDFGWPNFTSLRELLDDVLIKCIDDIEWVDNEHLINQCLTTLTGNNIVKLLDHYLPSLTSDLIKKEQRSWLLDRASPNAENGFWERLNSTSKKSLAKLLNLNLFNIYYKCLLDLLRDQPQLLAMDSDDGAETRVRSRLKFWSNYSEEMISCRLLVPKTTENALCLNPRAPRIYEVMDESDANACSEILVMQFESRIIVEQLRPSWSPVRIYHNSPVASGLLINTKTISEKDVLMAFQDAIHDHHYLWQWHLERVLRKEHEIRPNTGLTKFAGMSSQFNSYSDSDGLKTPEIKILRKRADRLEDWENHFYRNEDRLGKYKDVQQLDELIKSQRFLTFKNCGSERLYADQLRLEAGKGDKRAIEKLAHFLITKTKGTKEEREEGALWLEKVK